MITIILTNSSYSNDTRSKKIKIMKKNILFILLMGLSYICFPQSANHNYILSRTMLDDAGISYLDQVDYYDGLGRPVQSVIKNTTPLHRDLVTLKQYDVFGRDYKNWLPVSISANGAFVDTVTLKTNASAMYGGDLHPFSTTIYEASPLQRPIREYGPGEAWKTYPVRINYQANYTELKHLFLMGDQLIYDGTVYNPGSHYKTERIDEDGKSFTEYKDKQGRLFMQLSGTDVRTYYIYNDLGQLMYVLPPPLDDLLERGGYTEASDIIAQYAYVYKYDALGNCIYKKPPGCDPVQMKYDKSDRLVFSQDGNQRVKNEWSFFFYDLFGRLTVSGIWKSATVPEPGNSVVRSNYTGTGPLGGYTVNLTLASVQLLTVNYYDNHTFTMGVSQLNYMAPPAGYGARFNNAKGLLTGTRTYRLDDPTKSALSAFYHDHRGRIVQTRSSNHLGGYDYEYFAYTFTGKVRQRQSVHSAPGKTTQTETYAYDYGTPATNPAERLLSVSHKLNGSAAVTLARYTYDEAGRVLTKKVASETSTYDYNVRGWITGITGTKFNQTLAYNQTVNGITPAKPLYGGNIGAMKWKAGDETVERGYKFTYDGLSRLTAAAYGEGASLTANPDRFNETVTAYDKMGNILALQRGGKLSDTPAYGMVDNLTYTYTGNRLTRVSDAVTTPITYPGAFHFVDGANVPNEYTYDANGNLTKDLNKNIASISYNSLNLPSVVAFADGNTVSYGYDAAGSKLSVAYTVGGSTVKTEYAGNKVYGNGTLSMILTEEGYITLSGATPAYHYYLKDHQGNNRVVIDQAGTVEQVNHYYPFGGLFGEGLQSSNQPYKYNGKELDRFQNLDMYDYGARHYDAALGRWFTVDPMAEKYYSILPYVYVANNPVRFIDPDGREVRVAKEYQEQFRNDLQNVFGDRTNMLSFNDNGTLQFDGKAKDFTKGMTKNQKEAFKGLNKAMSDKQVTSVVYADNYDITVGNEVKSVDIVQEYGGGLYSKTDNLIVIAPSVGSVDVTLDQIQITADGLGFPTQNVQQNTTSTLFHEIGERNTTNINFRGAVIDFENYARRVIGLPVRPYDLNHSKTIKTNYTK